MRAISGFVLAGWLASGSCGTAVPHRTTRVLLRPRRPVRLPSLGGEFARVLVERRDIDRLDGSAELLDRPAACTQRRRPAGVRAG
jgi:hypothetical protein